MKSSSNARYSRIDAIPYRPYPKILVEGLKRLGHVVASYLTSSNEPSVQLMRDRFGESYWKIYDPISRTLIHLKTEQEVRSWLDSRYDAADSLRQGL